jgi:hypothetical protein
MDASLNPIFTGKHDENMPVKTAKETEMRVERICLNKNEV